MHLEGSLDPIDHGYMVKNKIHDINVSHSEYTWEPSAISMNKCTMFSSSVPGKHPRVAVYLFNTITLFHLGQLARWQTLVLSLAHCALTNSSIYSTLILRAGLQGEMKSTGVTTLSLMQCLWKSVWRLKLAAKSVSVGEFPSVFSHGRLSFHFSPFYSFEEDEVQTEAA